MLSAEQISVQKLVELGQGTKAMRLWSDGLISWAELQSGKFDSEMPERRLITVDDMVAFRAAIAEAEDDPEMRESLVRSLMLDALFTVAAGAPRAAELAEAALVTVRLSSRPYFDQAY